MFHFVFWCLFWAVPVFCYSSGGPSEICKNGLTPEHGVKGQITTAPYSIMGNNVMKAGDKISLTLNGDQFLGFAVQAYNKNNQPIGTFKIVESNKSQTLTCSDTDDTLTHKKIPRNNPIKSIKFDWIAPTDYKGKVKFISTIAKDGATFWVRKVSKEVTVQ